MFEHLTLTLAQQDGPPPPPAAGNATPGAAAQPSAGGAGTAAQAPGTPGVPGPTHSPVANNGQNATTTANGQALPPTAKSSPFGDPIMILALAVLAFMFFFTISSSRKEKKKRAALVSSLKKGSKVRTVGGIIGNIVELRDDGTVVIKVDENANTRIKFDRTAVTTILEEKAT